MNKLSKNVSDAYARLDELFRLGTVAVQKAQDESRRLGVPNVYSINGRIYYELPNGELSLEDPYAEPEPTLGDATKG